MQLPLTYLDSSVVEEIPLDLWGDLFEAVGWPEYLKGKRDSFQHNDVLTSFDHDNPSDELLLALEVIHDLGTESGREAIKSALADRKITVGFVSSELGEREYALRLFLQQRSDAALDYVFELQHGRIQI